MYSILICALIGALFGMMRNYMHRSGERLKQTTQTIGGAFVGAAAGCVGGIFLGLLASSALPMRDVASAPVELAAMEVDGVKGVFVVATSGGLSDPAYHLNKKVQDGGTVAVRLWASRNIHVMEDSRLENTGSWTTVTREADPTSPLFNWALSPDDRNMIIREELRVPVGTVVRKFEVAF